MAKAANVFPISPSFPGCFRTHSRGRLARDFTTPLSLSRLGLRSWREAGPVLERDHAEAGNQRLRDPEQRTTQREAVAEPVCVQADAELVRPEPAPEGPHVTNDGEDRHPARLDDAPPPGVQDQRVPDDDED